MKHRDYKISGHVTFQKKGGFPEGTWNTESVL